MPSKRETEKRRRRKMGSVCDFIYENEKNNLSRYAFHTVDTKGRLEPITPDDLRGEFQRDRDRIIHSKAFRRLMHKTQVFLAPEADHYRTRLTHTLEVSQVARSIARALRLNEDLCEAIALGHDLGHTPFGHAGERMLQRHYDPSFSHYAQSIRVVEKIENLNLTYEVKEGIFKHTLGGSETLEGQIIYESDHIAYINHDIDDAVRAGVICNEDIPRALRNGLGYSHGKRIDTMVRAIVSESYDKPYIKMEQEVREMTDELHKFLYASVYTNPVAKSQESKAEAMLMQLFDYFTDHPEQMPQSYYSILEEGNESVKRVVCDYISGMTDRHAISTFTRLFVPEGWRG